MPETRRHGFCLGAGDLLDRRSGASRRCSRAKLSSSSAVSNRFRRSGRSGWRGAGIMADAGRMGEEQRVMPYPALRML